MENNLTEIIVQPDDIDPLNHVNNIVYVKYLESARFDWYDEIGMNLDDLISRGLGIVLRNLEISYVNEARLGDTLTVKTIPYRQGRSSYTIKQVIYNQNDEIITESETVSVMIDLEKRKSIPLLEEIAKHFQSTNDHMVNKE